MQEAWLTTLEVVKKYDSTASREDLDKIVAVSVKNRLLDIKKSKKLPTIPLSDGFDIPDIENIEQCLFELYDELDDTDREILKLLLDGKDIQYICEAVNLKKRAVYNHFANIRAKLRT